MALDWCLEILKCASALYSGSRSLDQKRVFASFVKCSPLLRSKYIYCMLSREDSGATGRGVTDVRCSRAVLVLDIYMSRIANSMKFIDLESCAASGATTARLARANKAEKAAAGWEPSPHPTASRRNNEFTHADCTTHCGHHGRT